MKNQTQRLTLNLIFHPRAHVMLNVRGYLLFNSHPLISLTFLRAIPKKAKTNKHT
jgi:hypothetical protein